MGGYLAVSWRMKTEATLQVTTAASTTRMPAISPWPVAPVVMTKVPTSASTSSRLNISKSNRFIGVPPRGKMHYNILI